MNQTLQKVQHIEPTEVQENWSKVKLPNGDTLKFKHVVLGIVMHLNEDGTPRKNEDGAIQYGVILSPMISGVYPAEERKRQN